MGRAFRVNICKRFEGSRTAQRRGLTVMWSQQWPPMIPWELWNWCGPSELSGIQARGLGFVSPIGQSLNVVCPREGSVILGEAALLG